MNYTYILQFALAKGVGDMAIKKAISFLDTNEGWNWERLCNSRETLVSYLKLNEDVVESISLGEKYALELSSQLYNENINIILENSPLYPSKLKRLLGVNCPPVLYVQGNIELLKKASVGFCGSRKVSTKGLKITDDCARQLSNENIVVVSGYANGTDITAHKSALVNGGDTIIVLAEGILRKSLKSEVKEYLNSKNHIFISQFPPRLTWNSINAMKRNKVIIGLSDAMILVESGLSGGTFAAGEDSIKLGCPLFVIDYAKPEVSAEANPYFISKGGIPIRGNREGVPNLAMVQKIVAERCNISEVNIEKINVQIKLSI